MISYKQLYVIIWWRCHLKRSSANTESHHNLYMTQWMTQNIPHGKPTLWQGPAPWAQWVAAALNKVSLCASGAMNRHIPNDPRDMLCGLHVPLTGCSCTSSCCLRMQHYSPALLYTILVSWYSIITFCSTGNYISWCSFRINFLGGAVILLL